MSCFFVNDLDENGKKTGDVFKKKVFSDIPKTPDVALWRQAEWSIDGFCDGLNARSQQPYSFKGDKERKLYQ